MLVAALFHSCDEIEPDFLWPQAVAPLRHTRRDQRVGGEGLCLESVGTCVRRQVNEGERLAGVAEVSDAGFGNDVRRGIMADDPVADSNLTVEYHVGHAISEGLAPTGRPVRESRQRSTAVPEKSRVQRDGRHQ